MVSIGNLVFSGVTLLNDKRQKTVRNEGNSHTHTHIHTPSMNMHYPGLRSLSPHVSRKGRETPAGLDPLQAWSRGRNTA